MDSHREFFEGLAYDWNSQQPVERSSHLKYLVESKLPKFSTSRKILNVGSGTGVLPPILTACYPTLQVISIDFAWMMISHPENTPDSMRSQADVHALPFFAGCFDGVICHNSFPHFQDHPLAMKEMVRVLKQDVQLAVLHDINREMVNRVHVNASSEAIHHDVLPDPDRFRGLMEHCGLRNVQVSDGDNYFLAIGIK
jgi:ubiquinone/menaquinone biosynthesis C-methylase UbiE